MFNVMGWRVPHSRHCEKKALSWLSTYLHRSCMPVITDRCEYCVILS